jgi:nucleotide-binding universal stress UspA family protein
VLFGSDGSPESAAALDAAVALLGDRLGRLTVATVVPFGDVTAPERRAKEGLRRLTDRAPGANLEVLHGHPSAALRQFAAEGGYGLIVVGSRGKGLTNAFLGSAADELAHHSEIPVLVVGERQRVAALQSVGVGRLPSRP